MKQGTFWQKHSDQNNTHEGQYFFFATFEHNIHKKGFASHTNLHISL